MSWFSKNVWDPLVGNTDPTSVRNNMLQGIDQQGMRDQAAKYHTMGDQMMDIGSQRNIAAKESLMGMSADNLAQQELMAERRRYEAGVGGGMSGALEQAAAGNSQNLMNTAMQNFNKQFAQNQAQGMTMMNMGDQQTGQLNQLLTGANQAKVAQQQANAANTSGMIQGIASAAMPGLGSMATNFGMNALGMSGPGGGMGAGQAFMQPYAQGRANQQMGQNVRNTMYDNYMNQYGGG